MLLSCLAVLALGSVLGTAAAAGSRTATVDITALQPNPERSQRVAAGAMETYLLIYHEKHLVDGTTAHEAHVRAAGGAMVSTHQPIGVVFAHSTDPGFAAKLLRLDPDLLTASPTSGHGIKGGVTRVPPYDVQRVSAPLANATQRSQAAWGDSLSGEQWDMRQMQIPASHAAGNKGAGVKVGILDTGIDWTHPDLTSQIDYSLSVSCVGGVKNSSKYAWKDVDGHGTWCAGCVAAAANGIGIVGVAPKATLVAVRTGDSKGFFYPSAVVCAFMHAAAVGLHVTSNSYYADPYLYNCKYDPVQNAIYVAESRAVAYAISKGVVIVAAAGNENTNLDTVNWDSSSPNNAQPIWRPINSSCVEIPNELPGVVSVSATGVTKVKSYYSNYSLKFVQVAAPGGDDMITSAEAPNGLVLSTYLQSGRGGVIEDASKKSGHYAYLQGTSMATPHVAGVAALIISKALPGKLTPAAVTAILQSTADPLGCPKVSGTNCLPIPAIKGTSFYGAGFVNALSALTPLAKRPPPPHPPPRPPPPRLTCSNGNFVALVNNKKACKACVSATSPSAKNAAKNCYRSVSVSSGQSCGTAVLTIRAVKNSKGYCLDSRSKSHAVELRLTSAFSTGVVLKSIVASSLRLGALGASYPTKLTQAAGVAVATFSDPSLILKRGVSVALTGSAKAKYVDLKICFIGSTHIPVC